MKTFIADIIPKLKKFSHKLDNLTLLTNQHWVIIDELKNSKCVYIFRSNYELLISQNGKVEKDKWEYLGNNSLLVERKEECFLFRHGFFDSNILALKVDGRDEYVFLVNENNYGGDLNNIDKVWSFLETKYLGIIPSNQINASNNFFIDFILDKKINVVRNEFGKYVFVNNEGDILIDFIYDGAFDFSQGLARVFKTTNNIDYYGFLDENGNEVIPLIYEYAICFSEDLALVRLNRQFGFVNSSNSLVINIQFDGAISFKNGKAKVKKGGDYYYIDQKNEII